MPINTVELEKIDELHNKISTYRPFSDENLLRQIQDFYRVDCTWSSNAIEGSTYTLSETKILLEDGLTAGGKPLRDAIAVIGHGKAYDYMFSILSASCVRENDILYMHSLLSGSLENNAKAGKYRNNPILVTGSKYSTAAYKDIPKKMSLLLRDQDRLLVNNHPVVAAAKMHKEFVFIHPFGDGNGRIARLLMNCILLQHGFLPISIPPVLRNEYVQSLEKAHNNDDDFVNMIIRAEYETEKDFLRMINDNIQVDATMDYIDIENVPYTEQTEKIVREALNSCKNRPGVNPEDLQKSIRSDLQYIVKEYTGYWVQIPPDGDFEWRDTKD